jgi:glycosyltransferase involved in cell wall biosynthesis
VSFDEPFVSVLTPVYNGEKYLAECIESVLAQTYHNWEYLIVNNRSTDRTQAIAEGYASRDSRIRVQNYEDFVDFIESHNRSLRLASPSSKYCKVVSADDCLFPECIARLVQVAERHPSVGIVGSYQLSGGGAEWRVRWTGLPYQVEVIPGKDACRSLLLGGRYVFGVPTSSLYRADVVRSAKSFYPAWRPHADVSSCYEHLQKVDFGFVHQVLSYERVHESAITSGRRLLNTHREDLIWLLQRYGPVYLTKAEYDNRLEELLDDYYDLLATSLVNLRGRQFWSYHRKAIHDLGYPLFGTRAAKAVLLKVLDLALNPKSTIERIWVRLKGEKTESSLADGIG